MLLFKDRMSSYCRKCIFEIFFIAQISTILHKLKLAFSGQNQLKQTMSTSLLIGYAKINIYQRELKLSLLHLSFHVNWTDATLILISSICSQQDIQQMYSLRSQTASFRQLDN